MRIVIALGGNALLKRGEPLTSANQRSNVRAACEQIAKIHSGNQLVITHGNGPQVGLMALQSNAYKDVPMYPLDVLGAESVGMIGYMIQQEMANCIPKDYSLTTVLTQTEVDPKDPAFQKPSKPVGPVYSKAEAEAVAAEKGWTMAPDGDKFRRVVPSPLPTRIFGLKPLKTLIEHNYVLICAGGGGIPTYYDEDGRLCGAEAVIDKDLATALLASSVEADLLVIATDVDAVYLDWGKPEQRAVRAAHPDAIEKLPFAGGSMGPKVQAAVNFARATGKTAVIGALGDIEKIVKGEAGTRVSNDAAGVVTE
ncbi:carbamate kinase [Neisseria chenwenguii]|uniref:Carbamate kinase n=1 Tax=Neisseria chenwenguii TaxID=1853278 RepID=A0A220S1A1_9NEIS|nr:carbamate kinase [Neisseria chenwenguii]ASK26985.1 carbamate kinase [Neisseria chenwenguii]ROV56114.1 carbamate kinase [Neisseria chenwenguii]